MERRDSERKVRRQETMREERGGREWDDGINIFQKYSQTLPSVFETHEVLFIYLFFPASFLLLCVLSRRINYNCELWIQSKLPLED